MGIEEIVFVTATEIQGVEPLASFNTPAMLAKASDTPTGSFGAGRAKSYPMTTAGLASVLTDWGATDTYNAALIAWAQPEKPQNLVIIKRDAPVAVVKTIAFSAPLTAGDVVSGIVNFQTVSVTFATDMAATLTALAAAIQALDGIATAVSNGTDTITVTADPNWNLDISLSAEGGAEPTITIATATAGRTAAADVAAALAETATATWYSVSPVEADNGLSLALAAYMETTKKYLFFQSNTSNIGNGSSTSNIATWVQALGYRRNVPHYRHVLTDYANVAGAVTLLASDPGSIQYANRSLTGVVGSTEGQISTAQAGVAEGRNFNTYRQFTSNTSLIRQGTRADGQPAELTRDLDYAINKTRELVFNYLTANKKPNLDDNGRIAFIAVLQQALSDFVLRGIARNDVPASVVVPSLATQPSLAQRKFTGRIVFEYLKGQISAEINLEVGL